MAKNGEIVIRKIHKTYDITILGCVCYTFLFIVKRILLNFNNNII